LEPRLEQLINENERLRDLLALPSVTDSPVITARSVTYPGSPFLWTTLLDAGSDDGVQPYQPVIDHQGVIGRILSVGASSSRALLITDLNSRVPVMVLETGDHAILEGDNSRKPYLSFLEAAHKVEPGFQVVTSGDGGIFPPLLPIGVTEIEETGTLRVVPLADLARLEYVQIIQHKEPVAPEEFEAPEEPVATEEAPAVVSEGEEAAP
jgi:rod shape-determining protein MreC